MRTHIFLITLVFPILLYAQQNDTFVKEVQKYIENKQFIEAERLLKHQLTVTKNEDKALIEKLGDVYGQQQQWQNAANCYKKLVKRYPKVANYQYKYGGALGMKALANRFKAVRLIDDIKNAFTQAVRLDPQHKAAHWALVELHMQLPGIFGGSRKKALHYAAALEKLSNVEGYLAKGYIYEYDRHIEKAKIYYEKALENLDQLKDISRNQVRYKIGMLCSVHHVKLDKGLYHLKQYLQHATVQDATNLHMAYYTIAKIYRYKKEKEKAMTWIDKALDKNTDFKEALSEKNLIEAL